LRHEFVPQLNDPCRSGAIAGASILTKTSPSPLKTLAILKFRHLGTTFAKEYPEAFKQKKILWQKY
jgi:hypothetical protein